MFYLLESGNPTGRRSNAALHPEIEGKLAAASKIILSSGYGIELYGYEQIIRAVAASGRNENALVVLCVYNDIDERYMELLKEIEKGKVDLLITRNLTEAQYAAVLQNSDVYVRATDRDGDSIVVREAIQMGISVIATSIVPRPDGVHLYRHGNIDELVACLDETGDRKQAPSVAGAGDQQVMDVLRTAYGV